MRRRLRLGHSASRQYVTSQGACAKQLHPASTLQAAFGTASYELGAPMSPRLRMPIASNTKLFTSVALHQLQQQASALPRPHMGRAHGPARMLRPGCARAGSFETGIKRRLSCAQACPS